MGMILVILTALVPSIRDQTAGLCGVKRRLLPHSNTSRKLIRCGIRVADLPARRE